MKQIWVGQFFELLAHAMLGGELSRNDDGDVNDWRHSLSVEIKASGVQSSYGFRLDIEQMDRYLSLCQGFPFDRGWYGFYAYNNPSVRVGRKSSTALSKHKTERAVREYLTANIAWFVVVDLAVVSQWRALRPIATGSIKSHKDTETINVKCREIERLANGGFHEELTRYNLDPQGFEALSGHVRLDLRPTLFERYDLNFPVTAILPKEETGIARKMFKRRGLELHRRKR